MALVLVQPPDISTELMNAIVGYIKRNNLGWYEYFDAGSGNTWKVFADGAIRPLHEKRRPGPDRPLAKLVAHEST